MLATGNPTHAFDADNITDHIVVRHAEEGEKLLLLNDHEIDLCEDDLVITDSEGPVALAGVMGGAKDSILPKTERVILEVANFEATGIRRTALRYDNRTEASSRYEKAIDPERCDQALALSMKYFKELYPELKVTGYCDNYVKKLEPAEIDVDLVWLEKRLGKHLTNDEIQGKLKQLGFDVEIQGSNMHVTAPTWRSTGDISIKDDVMEEVARMYGYDNFEATEITTTFTGAINQKDISLIRNIKEYLAFRCGMQEIYTYPWMNDTFVNAVLPNTDGILKLSTPPAPDLSYIRSSLLPNLCEAVMKMSVTSIRSPFLRRHRYSSTEIILLFMMSPNPFRNSADISEALLQAVRRISLHCSEKQKVFWKICRAILIWKLMSSEKKRSRYGPTMWYG